MQGGEIAITASFGVALSCGQKTDELTIETLLAQADQALYQAKQSGRNCVALADVIVCD
ncbi:GGDEF domain-containing protein [Ornatilinea apprima]|uniref:GGDEF domain-containing protein n=1 Tax=Ornatilinea apprima TaxID=1134406 RepID=UPI0009E68CB5|nr:diguanylate cyclase [Ornatilinea apprima]